MGDPGATQVIIFLLGLMDGESKILTGWGCMRGDVGAYAGGMTGKVGQWVSNSMSHYPTDWSRGVALMISLPSILKTKMYWETCLSSCIPTPNTPLEFPLDIIFLLWCRKRRGGHLEMSKVAYIIS